MSKNLAISSVLAMLIGAFMMNAAWGHNSQGEIHSDGTIDWSYWLLIGFSWFLPVFIFSGLFGLLVMRFLGQDTTSNRRAGQYGGEHLASRSESK